MTRLAERMTRVGPSPTMRVPIAAERLRRRGVHVVDLGVGEPDFATPAHVKAAAHAAIDADFTRYTANAGAEELRAAICARYRADFGVAYTPAEVIVSAGGKQALVNAALALFGPGDEVVTHAPGWPSLVQQIALAEAAPVVVRAHADEGFALGADAFLAAVTPRTRGFVINSPCNPTGAVMPEAELARIADAAAARGLWLVLDLCYDRLIYDDVPPNLPRVVAERARDRGVLCGSASKAYAMTGWRCGWALAPAPVIAACDALQSHSTSNVSSVTQRAALAAVTGPQDCVAAMREEYRRRRDAAWAFFTAHPRVRAAKPAGAFYLFLDVTDALSPDGVRTSAELADRLLEEHHVATMPGEAFDAPGFLRVSFAASLESLREGAARLHALIDAIAPDSDLRATPAR